jgi:hypothetical protein
MMGIKTDGYEGRSGMTVNLMSEYPCMNSLDENYIRSPLLCITRRHR